MERVSYHRANLHKANLYQAQLQGEDMRYANLTEADLSFADMRNANLTGADLTDVAMTGVNLSSALLSNAALSGADLQGTNLVGADLTNVSLSDANLTNADLSNAKLIGADLRRTNLTGTNLGGTFLMHAISLQTLFINNTNLHQAKGLDEMLFLGPSVLDFQTLRGNVANLPISFLKGVGYTDSEIRTLQLQYAGSVRKPTSPEHKSYQSCHIVRSQTDVGLANLLYEDITLDYISCWQYPPDVSTIKVWDGLIDDVTGLLDRIVVICSQATLSQRNIVEVVVDALYRASTTNWGRIFCILVDDFLLSHEFAVLISKRLARREIKITWEHCLANINILNFKDWEIEAAYKAKLQELLVMFNSDTTRIK